MNPVAAVTKAAYLNPYSKRKIVAMENALIRKIESGPNLAILKKSAIRTV